MDDLRYDLESDTPSISNSFPQYRSQSKQWAITNLNIPPLNLVDNRNIQPRIHDIGNNLEHRLNRRDVLPPQRSIMAHGKVNAVGLYVLLKLRGVYRGELVDLDVGVHFLEIRLQVLVDDLSC